MSAAPATAAAAAAYIAISPVEGIKPPVVMLGCAGGRVDERRLQAARRPVRAVGAQGDSAVMVSLGLAAATWSTSRPSALTVTERAPSKAV